MLINGKQIAQEIYNSVAERVVRLPFQPVFCDVLVGDDAASKQYVKMKARTAEKLGMKFLQAEFPVTISETELIKAISEINHTPHLAGLIVQLPLPHGFNRTKVLDVINTAVDVDCLTTINGNLFYSGQGVLVPPTPAAVLAVLDSVIGHAQSLHCVVVGQGELVGRPVTYLLKSRGYDVTVIDSSTQDPEVVCRKADIVITGAGKPGLVTDAWIKPGSIVVDAGTAENEGTVVGDVNAEAVGPIAGFLSPTPGGVGPVTVAKLLENVVMVAERMARL